MALDKIVIRGARQNNLKNIDLEIPRDKLIVFTGLSGSAARPLSLLIPSTQTASGAMWRAFPPTPGMFLGQMEKPDVD